MRAQEIRYWTILISSAVCGPRSSNRGPPAAAGSLTPCYCSHFRRPADYCRLRGRCCRRQAALIVIRWRRAGRCRRSRAPWPGTRRPRRCLGGTRERGGTGGQFPCPRAVPCRGSATSWSCPSSMSCWPSSGGLLRCCWASLLGLTLPGTRSEASPAALPVFKSTKKSVIYCNVIRCFYCRKIMKYKTSHPHKIIDFNKIYYIVLIKWLQTIYYYNKIQYNLIRIIVISCVLHLFQV